MNKPNKISELYKSTVHFSFLKFLMGAALILVNLVLFIVLYSVGNAIGEDVGAIFLLIWIVVAVIIFVYMYSRRTGFIWCMGHLSALSEYIKTNYAPDSAYRYCQYTFRDRFYSTDEYFKVRNGIKKTVRQLYAHIEKGGEVYGKRTPVLPEITLRYIDRSIAGYLFYADNVNIYRAATKAIVIMYENRQKLFKRIKSVNTVVLATVAAVFLILFGVFELIFISIPPTQGYSILIAIAFAAMFTFVLKNSFLDSFYEITFTYLLIKNTRSTIIDADVVDELKKKSPELRKLHSAAFNGEHGSRTERNVKREGVRR